MKFTLISAYLLLSIIISDSYGNKPYNVREPYVISRYIYFNNETLDTSKSAEALNELFKLNKLDTNLMFVIHYGGKPDNLIDLWIKGKDQAKNFLEYLIKNGFKAKKTSVAYGGLVNAIFYDSSFSSFDSIFNSRVEVFFGKEYGYEPILNLDDRMPFNTGEGHDMKDIARYGRMQERGLYRTIYVTRNIHFGLDSIIPRNSNLIEYQQMADVINTHPKLIFRVCKGGVLYNSSDYAINLNKARASTIRDILIRNYGVNPNQIISSELTKNRYPITDSTKDKDFTKLILNSRLCLDIVGVIE